MQIVSWICPFKGGRQSYTRSNPSSSTENWWDSLEHRVSALSWVILYSSPFHHICFTVTPLGWTAASPDILSCADIAWNSRILVLIHFFFPSDKNKTTLVSLSIHALLHTSVLSFLHQSLTSKSMRGAWKYSFFVIIQQGLYQFLC